MKERSKGIKHASIIINLFFLLFLASCNLALGMESGFITDGALTSQNPRGNPQAGRLNTKVQGNLHGWLASPYETEDYLQIDLGVLYQITKIAVQGEWIIATELSQHFVKKYTVMFSNDSQTWSNYTENGEKRVCFVLEILLLSYHTIACTQRTAKHFTAPHNASAMQVQYNTLQYITFTYIHYNTLHYNTLQYNTIHTIHYDTSQDLTIHSIHYNTLQYVTIHYNTLQYITIRYNT